MNKIDANEEEKGRKKRLKWEIKMTKRRIDKEKLKELGKQVKEN